VSIIPNNVQMRWIDDDGRVTVFRNSGYSNGNTFDYEGVSRPASMAAGASCATNRAAR
jgi:hypothetical protein